MRAIADTLPILREEPTSVLLGDPNGPPMVFGAEAITKALSAKRAAPLAATARKSGSAETQTQPEDGEESHASDSGSQTPPATAAKQSAPDDASTRSGNETVLGFKERLRQIRERSAAGASAERAAKPAAPAHDVARPTASKKGGPREAARPTDTKPAGSPIPLLDGGVERTEAAIASAVASALEDARKAHTSELEAALRAQKDKAAEELRTAREAWVSEEGERLAKALAETIEGVRDDLRTAVSEVLAPVVETAVRERALDEFASVLSRLMDDEETPFLTVDGPKDLIEDLRARLADVTTLSFQPGASEELSVRVGDTEIRTALAEWAATIDTAKAQA